jgi:hypothetical protein
MAKFLACCAIQAACGWGVQPAIHTRRLPRCKKNRKRLFKKRVESNQWNAHACSVILALMKKLLLIIALLAPTLCFAQRTLSTQPGNNFFGLLSP